jgi:hypothetical protein
MFSGKWNTGAFLLKFRITNNDLIHRSGEGIDISYESSSGSWRRKQ